MLKPSYSIDDRKKSFSAIIAQIKISLEYNIIS